MLSVSSGWCSLLRTVATAQAKLSTLKACAGNAARLGLNSSASRDWYCSWKNCLQAKHKIGQKEEARMKLCCCCCCLAAVFLGSMVPKLQRTMPRHHSTLFAGICHLPCRKATTTLLFRVRWHPPDSEKQGEGGYPVAVHQLKLTPAAPQQLDSLVAPD
jgi:hypothetical protein